MTTTQAKINALYEKFIALQSGLNDLKSTMLGNRLLIFREGLDPRFSSYHRDSFKTPKAVARRRKASDQALATHEALIETLILISKEHSETVEGVSKLKKTLAGETGTLIPSDSNLADIAKLEEWAGDIRASTAWIWEEILLSSLPE